VFGSVLLYGAFLAFAVGVPVFFALSFVEGTVRDRLGTGDERPRPDGPDAAPEAPDRGAPAAGGEVAD
jgi:hypothetical protein